MKVDLKKQWTKFSNDLRSNGFNKASVKLIEKAWNFAISKHEGQLRKSGEPYVIHLLETARNLLEWGMDTDTIVAGILHDVLEDTDASFDQIKKEFSKDIAVIVFNVTKTSKLSAQTRKEIGNEVSKKNDDYIINILLSISNDIRILTVKMADRLHNIQTIKHLSPEKQMRIAQETFNIYASIAGRIGMYHLKTRLLDLSYAVIDAEKYKLVKEKLDEFFEKNAKDYESFADKLNSVLHQSNIEFELKERKKGVYSTSLKLKEHDKVRDIKDIFAIRIVLKGDELDCFKVLGLLHLNFKHVKNTFKDYISRPKGNLYQSIHTVIIYNSVFIEVQIRTEIMDRIANYGIAAHWKYKQQNTLIKEMFSDIIEKFEHGNENDINIRELTIGKLIDVYVIDNEQVYSVPNNWTLLDIAYRVNAEKLPYLVSPTVDGIKVSISKKVDHNNKIELEYSKHFTINKNWLNYCSSLETIAWIQNFLKKVEVEEDSIAKVFYSEIATHLADKYVGDENFKLRIVELGFTGANELLAYLYNNTNNLCEKDIHGLASKIGKTWKEAARKIKKIKEERMFQDNLYFNIPNFLYYRRISYPSCCTKAPYVDCVGQLEKSQLIIHNYKCSRIVPNKQKYILTWDAEKLAKGTKVFNVILQFIADSEKVNDIISYIVNYQMRIKKIETTRLDNYSIKMIVHIGCASVKVGENILSDLNLNFYIKKASIL